MNYKDWINVGAILLSPIIAVVITLWYQRYTEKRKVKIDLFLNLMKNRHSIFIPLDHIQALNSIDVVFEDSEKIKNLWAQYYDDLNSSGQDQKKRDRLYTDLLSEIASHLGYQKLRQTQIEKYYNPQAHADEIVRNNEVLAEFLRVLKASETFGSSSSKSN